MKQQNSRMERRRFLQTLLAGGVGYTAFSITRPWADPMGEALAAEKPPRPKVAVAHGTKVDPRKLTRQAIAALGGMGRFVKKGDDVIVKPNICNAYHGPEYASTTNPDVVGEVVALCIAAGARRVRVMDFPFGGTPQAAYEKSGIRKAVEAAGGQMEVMAPFKFKKTPIPKGKDIKEWWIYTPVLEADVLIDIPIAKHHVLAGLTLAIKNLMGVIQRRSRLHPNLHQRLADLTTRVRPTLTIVDAVRMLMKHGPTGGDLRDVKRMDTVIASADIVAADAYATTLFGKKPSDIGYIQKAAEMGLGVMDLDSMQIERIEVV